MQIHPLVSLAVVQLGKNPSCLCNTHRVRCSRILALSPLSKWEFHGRKFLAVRGAIIAAKSHSNLTLVSFGCPPPDPLYGSSGSSFFFFAYSEVAIMIMMMMMMMSPICITFFAC